jgi:hypothetical protein
MTIEDMKHMEVLDAFGRELQAMLVDYNARANGKTDKAEVCELRLEQNAALLELLTQQRRAIEHMLGKPIDPQTHFGEAIVTGAFGGNA